MLYCTALFLAAIVFWLDSSFTPKAAGYNKSVVPEAALTLDLITQPIAIDKPAIITKSIMPTQSYSGFLVQDAEVEAFSKSDSLGALIALVVKPKIDGSQLTRFVFLDSLWFKQKTTWFRLSCMVYPSQAFFRVSRFSSTAR
jgi:hypothetical protein